MSEAIKREGISEPGFYEMSAEAYHADPCVVPSLSHSLLKILLTRSPRHAARHHPRLNPQPEREITASMDKGSALHKLLLGRGADIEVLPFGDYKPTAAREAREAARAAGRIPLLKHHMEDVEACANSALADMRHTPDLRGFFKPGRSEIVMIWREGSVMCRSMIDRLPDDQSLPPYDCKTTGMSAAPGAWDRQLQTEYATQDAFYSRGLAALGRNPLPMKFAVIEQDDPFGVAPYEADSNLREWADIEVSRAIDIWDRSMKSGRWPSYPAHTNYVPLTSRLMDRQAEAQARDVFTKSAAKETAGRAFAREEMFA